MNNILFINPTSRIGGAEKSLLQILNGLDRKRFNPIVLLPSSGPLPDELKLMGIKVVFAPRPIIEAHSMIEIPIALFWLNLLVKKYRISLVHSNSKFSSRLPALYAGYSRKNAVLHWRDFSLWPDEKRYINKYQDRLVFFAISNAVRDFLIENGIDPMHIRIIYDGAAPSFYQLPLPSSHTPHPLKLAITGRIDNWKGHEYLIEALGMLKDLPVELLVFGEFHKVNDPGYLDKLKGRIDSLGIADRVKFLGFQKDPAGSLAGVDVVCVPSLFEPFGMVAVEAMAAGRPVIASNTGGLKDIIVDGLTGFLIEPKDPRIIAEKINLLYTDPGLREKMGKAGRERARSNFSITEQIRNIEEIYDGIISHNPDH